VLVFAGHHVVDQEQTDRRSFISYGRIGYMFALKA